MHIPILLYHHVDSDVARISDPYCVSARRFRWQMEYLALHGYTSIDLNTAARIQSGEHFEGKPVIITFDDGYTNNYSIAFPILQELGLAATIFLLPDYCGKFAPESGDAMLNWQQIAEMSRYDVDFQSHGMSHTTLLGKNPALIYKEAIESKKMLSDQLAKQIDFFAYPFGQYDNVVQSQIQAAGYIGACGGTPMLDGSWPDDYAIGRTEIFESDRHLHFGFKVKRGYDYQLYLRKLGGRVKRRFRSS
ncbi:polysaccharide deacetylase family protein [bacterium]|nr:polysaccharide deacetylase family protein [bacterium]